MKKRVILILSDGMRHDSLPACGNPYVAQFSSESAVWDNTSTVFPSVTLPCHMSLIHSVPPTRHGVTTNTFSPMVRPVDGLFEQLSKFNKKCAFFFSWEQLKDIYQPGSMTATTFLATKWYDGYEMLNNRLTDLALQYMDESEDLDFIFLYLHWSDCAGHDDGWMSEEYMRSVSNAWDNVKRVVEKATENDTIIVTADHGGHDRIHGHDIPEDMHIPLLMRGAEIKPGVRTEAVNIMDIPPSVSCWMFLPTAIGRVRACYENRA